MIIYLIAGVQNMEKNYLSKNGGYKIKIKCFNPIDKCYLLGWFIQ